VLKARTSLDEAFLAVFNRTAFSAGTSTLLHDTGKLRPGKSGGAVFRKPEPDRNAVDFKDIKRIVELMDQHGLSQFKLEQDDTVLELKKGGELDITAVQRLLASAPAPAAYAAAPLAAPAAPAVEAGLPAGVTEIVSPMVGTFYSAGAPDADPFAKVGTKVGPDSTVCIIEAMKVMNEIKADVSGEIVEVLVENGTAVQYGEPLFRVKKA